MTTKKCTAELEQFRQQLYQNFNNRADTLMELDDLTTAHLLATAPRLHEGKLFWLLGTDVTPQPRQFAHTLADNGMVYQLNTISGMILNTFFALVKKFVTTKPRTGSPD